MRTATCLRLFVFLATLLLVFLGVTPSASALEESPATHISVTTGTASAESVLEIQFDELLTNEEKELATLSLQGAAVQKTDTTTPSMNSTNGPATNQRISCAIGSYRFSDSNGAFTVRNNCPYNNVNWGYKLSSSLASKVTGLVTEDGMAWYKGGIKRGGGGGHVVAPTYFFHGTMSNCRNGETVTYADRLTFRVMVNGQAGTAILRLQGTIVLVA